MGLTGVHLLVVELMILVLGAVAAAAVYLLVKKATAAGIRDAGGARSLQGRKTR